MAFVGKKPAGIALYFHNFELAKIACDRDCSRFEWSVLDWNEDAIRFYRRPGAEPMADRTAQRLTRDKIERLAEG